MSAEIITTAYLWTMAAFWTVFLIVGFRDEGYNGWNVAWRAALAAWALLCLVTR